MKNAQSLDIGLDIISSSSSISRGKEQKNDVKSFPRETQKEEKNEQDMA